VNQEPIVSVIMPVYNGEPYLREAIDSILAQTYTNFELLVVDDNSTDLTVNIVQSYADPRIRLLTAAHEGIAQALNKGLAAARGNYVARMDSDDVSAPHRLEKQVAYLMLHQGVVMVGSWARLIDQESNNIGTCRTLLTRGRQLRVALWADNQFVHGSVMMRRDAVRAVADYRYDFTTSEDYDMWLRLAEIGELANLAEPLYHLRVHQSSKTANEGAYRVKDLARLAQHCAIDRYVFGCDRLGYRSPVTVSTAEHRTRSLTESTWNNIALSDWLQVCLWQGQIRQSLKLLRHALANPRKEQWMLSVIGPHYLSKGKVRDLLLSGRRAWRRWYRRARIGRSNA